MSQNIYDRQDFFTAYSEIIDRSGHKDLDTDLLWKRLRTLLPPPAVINNAHILDVGCGSGWFARWAVDHGAASVTAVDISRNMIAKAHTLNGDNDVYKAKIAYRIVDLDADPDGVDSGRMYDFAFSSLTLHYLAHLERLMARVCALLKPGAAFVVNVEHPVYTAPQKPRVVKDAETGEKSWNFSDYYKEGERVVDWLAPGLRKQHRTVQGYMSIFFESGFDLTGFIELLPTKEELEAGEFDEEELLRPLFLMMGLRKRQ